MSQMPPPLYGGGTQSGGIVGYPLETLRQEVAALAIHFHWSYEAIMMMEHRERQGWVHELSLLLNTQ